jgi:RAS protein activator-like 2
MYELFLALSELHCNGLKKTTEIYNIIFFYFYRLMTVEKELKADQEDMQSLVRQKQRVIEAQERRIQTLDNANAKLMTALTQLRNVSQQSHNGMIGPLRSTIMSTEIAEFKTSSC